MIKAIETKYAGHRFRSRLEARWAVFFDTLGVRYEYEPEGFDLTDAYLEHLIKANNERQEELEFNNKIQAAIGSKNISDLPDGVWSSSEAIVAMDKYDYCPFGREPLPSIPEEDIWDYLRKNEWMPVRDEVSVDETVKLRYLPDFWLPEINTWIEVKPNVGNLIDLELHHVLFAESCAGRFVLLCGSPEAPSEDYGDHGQGAYSGMVVCDHNYYWCECPSCGAIGIQFDARSARNKHKPGCKAMTGDKGYNARSPRLLEAYEAARSARFEHGETPERHHLNGATP